MTENPKVYAAFVAALKQSIEMIRADKKVAAQVLLDSMGGKGWTLDELVEILNDRDVYYTMRPENVTKYATFMHDIGSLKGLPPTSIKDLFFSAGDIGEGN